MISGKSIGSKPSWPISRLVSTNELLKVSIFSLSLLQDINTINTIMKETTFFLYPLLNAVAFVFLFVVVAGSSLNPQIRFSVHR